MILHSRPRRSAAKGVATPAAEGGGSVLSRPSRFVANTHPVRALWHDGSDAQVAAVREWVRQAGAPDVKAEVEPGAVVVVRQSWPAEPVCLRPGMFLALTCNGWMVYSAEQFQAAFQPAPRELPIFDDGEVA